MNFKVCARAPDISVPRINHEWDEAALVRGALVSVISSAARNLGPKTKISQSPPLASFESVSFRNDNG